MADWFAVTALFHHPLGLKIPHTNLIEQSKERIGDNLGISWLLIFFAAKYKTLHTEFEGFSFHWRMASEREKPSNILVKNLSEMVLDILHKLEDDAVVNFISKKAKEMTGTY